MFSGHTEAVAGFWKNIYNHKYQVKNTWKRQCTETGSQLPKRHHHSVKRGMKFVFDSKKSFFLCVIS